MTSTYKTNFVLTSSASQTETSTVAANLYTGTVQLVYYTSTGTCSSYTTVENAVIPLSSTYNGDQGQYMWFQNNFTLRQDLNPMNYASYNIFLTLGGELFTNSAEVWYVVAYLSVDTNKMASVVYPIGVDQNTASFNGSGTESYINISLLFPGMILRSNKIYSLEVRLISNLYTLQVATDPEQLANVNLIPSSYGASPLPMCFTSQVSITPLLYNTNSLMNYQLSIKAIYQYQTIIPTFYSTTSTPTSPQLNYPMTYVDVPTLRSIPPSATSSAYGFIDQTYTNYVSAGIVFQNNAMCNPNDISQNLTMVVGNLQTYTGTSANYSAVLSCVINRKVYFSPLVSLDSTVYNLAFPVTYVANALTLTATQGTIKLSCSFVATGTAGTSTNNTLTVSSINYGKIYPGSAGTYFTVSSATYIITSQTNGTTGGVGTYVYSLSSGTNASFSSQTITGYVASQFQGYSKGTTLTITKVVSGELFIGMDFSGGAFSTQTTIIGLGTGTGGTGTYTMDQAQTVGSASSPVTIYLALPFGSVIYGTNINPVTILSATSYNTYPISRALSSSSFTSTTCYINIAQLIFPISYYFPTILTSPGVLGYVTMDAYLTTINSNELSFLPFTFLSSAELLGLSIGSGQQNGSSTNSDKSNFNYTLTYESSSGPNPTGSFTPTYSNTSCFPEDAVCSIQGFAQYPSVNIQSGFSSSSISYKHQSQYMNITKTTRTLTLPVTSVASGSIFTMSTAQFIFVGMYIVVTGTVGSSMTARWSPYSTGYVYKISTVSGQSGGTYTGFQMTQADGTSLTSVTAGTVSGLTFTISSYTYYLPQAVTYNLIFEILTPLNDITDSNSIIVTFRNFGYGNPSNYYYTISATLQADNGLMFTSQNMVYQLGAGSDQGWIQTGYNNNTIAGYAQGIGNTIPAVSTYYFLLVTNMLYDLGSLYTTGPVWCNNLLPYPYPGVCYNPVLANQDSGVSNLGNGAYNNLNKVQAFNQWMGYINVTSQNNNNNWFVITGKNVLSGLYIQVYDSVPTTNGIYNSSGNYILLFAFQISNSAFTQWYQFQKPGLYPIIISYYNATNNSGYLTGLTMGFYGDKSSSNLFTANNQDPSSTMQGINSGFTTCENPTFPGMTGKTTASTKSAQVVISNGSYTQNDTYLYDTTVYKNLGGSTGLWGSELGCQNPLDQWNALPAYIMSPSIVLNINTLFPQNSFLPGISYTLKINFIKVINENNF